MKIAITGATGFVGSGLVRQLHKDGHSVLIFTRNRDRALKVFPAGIYPNVEVVAYTPLASGDWQQRISGCDGVVNLAGEPISERWTPERKKSIMNSRKIGTEKIAEAIAQAEAKPSVLVSGSAIGYYGTSETATFDEGSSPNPENFLSQVCIAWESAAKPVTDSGTRLVILRIGIVLGMGGAIARMVTPFRLYAGGPIGSGKQWFSWIHRDDLIGLIVKALKDSSLQGTYNATAPNPVRMTTFCQTLGKVMERPSWLPVPDFAIQALLGDGAQVVLEGQQVLPKRTESTDFTYQYSEVEPALRSIVG